MLFETFLKVKQRVTSWKNPFELGFRTSMTGRTLAGGDLQVGDGVRGVHVQLRLRSGAEVVVT